MRTEIISKDTLTTYLEILYNDEVMGMEDDRYTCFGAYNDKNGKPMGILVAEVLPVCIRIKRLFVVPEFRRKKVATTLFNALTDLPDEVRLPVIFHGTEEEYSEEFLNAVGFSEVESDFSYIEVLLQDYKKLTIPEYASAYQLFPADKVPEKSLRNFVLHMQKEFRTEFPSLFLNSEYFNDGSVVCMKSDKIVATVLLEETDDYIKIPFAFGSDNKGILFCFSLLRYELREEYDLEASLRFLVKNNKKKDVILDIVNNPVEKKIHIFEYRHTGGKSDG